MFPDTHGIGRLWPQGSRNPDRESQPKWKTRARSRATAGSKSRISPLRAFGGSAVVRGCGHWTPILRHIRPYPENMNWLRNACRFGVGFCTKSSGKRGAPIDRPCHWVSRLMIAPWLSCQAGCAVKSCDSSSRRTPCAHRHWASCARHEFARDGRNRGGYGLR